jgi:hypothetical protein
MTPNPITRLKFAGLYIKDQKVKARPGFNRYQLSLMQKDEIISVLNKLRSEDSNLISKFENLSLWGHIKYWLMSQFK